MPPRASRLRITVIGASGRMGRAVIRSAAEFPELAIVAAVVSPMSEALGRDAGLLAGVPESGLSVTADLQDALAGSDVAVDFSSAGALPAHIQACRQAQRALLVGTTGHRAEAEAVLAAAAEEIPLLVAANTSLGVAVLTELVRAAAAALPPQFDIEIIEAHHRTKQDAPSGTALALGQVAGQARRRPNGVEGARSRSAGARREGEIGFASVRAGDLVGEHTVLFAGEGERLSLSHQATDRAVFARGALRAAAWLSLQPAGRYSMSDIVSIKS